MKNIYIQHLGYTIHVKDIKEADNPKDFAMFVEREDRNNCIMYLTKKKWVLKDIPALSHEIVHVLQFIADSRSIDMTFEQEHMGYLMQYIMCELLGYEYKKLYQI
jgi:hypothetical protein